MVDLSRIYTFSMIPLGILFILSAKDLFKSHHEYKPIIDIEPQVMSIKDGKYVNIDYIIYTQIIDQKLFKKKDNIKELMRSESLHIFEDIIRNMTYEMILNRRESIEDNLRVQLDGYIRKYGIGVKRVALRNVLEEDRSGQIFQTILSLRD